MKLPHFFHQWRTIRDEGVHRYQECLGCKQRRSVGTSVKGDATLDKVWLAGGDWSIWSDIGPPPVRVKPAS